LQTEESGEDDSEVPGLTRTNGTRRGPFGNSFPKKSCQNGGKRGVGKVLSSGNTWHDIWYRRKKKKRGKYFKKESKGSGPKKEEVTREKVEAGKGRKNIGGLGLSVETIGTWAGKGRLEIIEDFDFMLVTEEVDREGPK